MVKFAHLADVHLDAWREEELKRLNLLAFSKTIDEVIRENVDFVIIAGDLFHTSMPSLESMRLAARKFKELVEQSIKVYVVPGSHDYSKDELSIIDVLDEAGLCENVAKGKEENEKILLQPTCHNEKVVIYGMMGKKNGLERELYENLLPIPLNEDKINIFVMHSAVEGLTSKEFANVPSIPYNLLPKNFDYYASGHIHKYEEKTFEEKTFVYPGHLYPSNFKELEKSKGKGNYVIVKIDEQTKKVSVEKREVLIKEVV
ncbi:MAG: DNA repair exonuclease, partial [Candidatus Nanohaloarchaeota archaeon]|nr:DNA repair exonuclease [Candidatus Nanohaloarchaeota archaeon]